MTETTSIPDFVLPGGSAFAARAGYDDPRRVVELSGELDMASAPAAILACTSRSRREVIVDMSGLTFMDCAGYGALATARSILRHRGGSMTLINVSGEPQRLLSLIDELEGHPCRATAMVSSAGRVHTRSVRDNVSSASAGRTVGVGG